MSCAFDRGIECRALSEKICEIRECSFYQTEEQLRHGQAKSIERLKELGKFQEYKRKYGRIVQKSGFY